MPTGWSAVPAGTSSRSKAPSPPAATRSSISCTASTSIDLDGIDADPTRPGDQTFRFIGKAGFSGAGAELRYRDGHLTADLDGDGLRDFHLTIANAPALTAADFLL